MTNPAVAGVMAEPQAEQAFLLNLEEHWFTLRRTGRGHGSSGRLPRSSRLEPIPFPSADDGTWWNLNSLNPGPEELSPFYLAAFLGSMRDQVREQAGRLGVTASG